MARLHILLGLLLAGGVAALWLVVMPDAQEADRTARSGAAGAGPAPLPTDEDPVIRAEEAVEPVVTTPFTPKGQAGAESPATDPGEPGLAIQVVDQGGAPVADVPVMLRRANEGGSWRIWSGTTTAPHGLARVKSISTVLSAVRRGDVLLGEDRLRRSLPDQRAPSLRPDSSG